MMEQNGKYIFGLVKVGERGQIVIPKAARDIFKISPGDLMLVLGDRESGLAIVKSEILQDSANEILNPPESREKKD